MASARVVGDIAPLQAAAPMDEKDQEYVEHAKAVERMLESAKSATEKEHKMTLMQGIRLYPKAIFWSVLISSTIIMVRANAPAAHHALVADHPDRRATTCV